MSIIVLLPLFSVEFIYLFNQGELIMTLNNVKYPAKELPKKLTGIIPPIVTPLLDRDTLDQSGLDSLIEHILAGGVHGLFVLGSTGEAPSLSYRLRRELVEETCRKVAGRVPVLVGITDTSMVESINMAEFSATVGASAVVVAPPYYFPSGQPELLEYLEHLSLDISLPIFLYNMPSLTKVVFEPETVLAAADIPGIVGLKDSSGDMVYFHKVQKLLENHSDFSLLVGPEELLAETLLLGGNGGVAGGANLIPELYVGLFNAAERRDIDEVVRYHKRIMDISCALYGIGQFNSGFVKSIKCALSISGICNDYLADPFHRFREKERKLVRKCMEDLDLIAE